MNFKKRLEAVEIIISEITVMSPTQRLISYCAIKTILDEIELYINEHESENLDCGNAETYITQMYGPLEALTGLDHSGHPENQNIGWLMTALDKLRSVHCFNIHE
jgi:hypothetical protein